MVVDYAKKYYFPLHDRYQKLVADFPYNAEVIQPPLYHLMLAPLYVVAPGGLIGKLLALRMVSVVLGVLTIAVVYAIAADLFPWWGTDPTISPRWRTS